MPSTPELRNPFLLPVLLLKPTCVNFPHLVPLATLKLVVHFCVPSTRIHMFEKKLPASLASETVRAPPPSPTSACSRLTASEPHLHNPVSDAFTYPPPRRDSPQLESFREKTGTTTARQRSAPLLNLSASLVLENSGSVARDHLASERTFLAYVRTSLVIVTTGVGE